jgi:NAD(P)H-quinone oxidoreductase subunit 5
VKGTRVLAQVVSFFDEWIIDGIVNGFSLLIAFGGESTKYLEGGRISSYLFGLIFGMCLSLIISSIGIGVMF